MKRAQLVISVIVAIVLLVVIPLLFLALSPNYNYCAGHQGSYYLDSTDPGATSRLTERINSPTFINLFLYCSSVYVTQNAGALTAFATILLAVVTLALVAIAIAQWTAARRSNEHFQATERAYVKLSHYPPGVQFIQNMGAPHIVMAVQIKNHGHTPAHVSDVYIDSRIVPADQGLPATPLYPQLEGREVAAAFLVANDEFLHRVDLGITNADHAAIMDGTSELYIVGYVDYQDKFGQRHRGTYARAYEPEIDAPPHNVAAAEDFANRNNLTIVSIPQYNDDRPRVWGEGADWT